MRVLNLSPQASFFSGTNGRTGQMTFSPSAKPPAGTNAAGDQITLFGNQNGAIRREALALLDKISSADLTQATDWEYYHAPDPEFKTNQAYTFQLDGTAYSVRHFQADPQRGRSYVQTPQYRIRRGRGREYDITRKEFETVAAQIEPHAKTAIAANFGFDRHLNLVPVLAKAALAALDEPAAEINVHNLNSGYFSIDLPPGNGTSPLEETDISVTMDRSKPDTYQTVFFKNPKGAYDAPVNTESEIQAVSLFLEALKMAETQLFMQNTSLQTIPEWQQYTSTFQQQVEALRTKLKALSGSQN